MRINQDGVSISVFGWNLFSYCNTGGRSGWIRIGNKYGVQWRDARNSDALFSERRGRKYGVYFRYRRILLFREPLVIEIDPWNSFTHHVVSENDNQSGRVYFRVVGTKLYRVLESDSDVPVDIRRNKVPLDIRYRLELHAREFGQQDGKNVEPKRMSKFREAVIQAWLYFGFAVYWIGWIGGMVAWGLTTMQGIGVGVLCVVAWIVVIQLLTKQWIWKI